MIQKLVDPIPCFIPMWTNAINFAQLPTNKSLTEKATVLIKNKFNMDYSDCPSCLVGEAHEQLGKGTEETYTNAFDNNGYCRRCTMMCGDQALHAVKSGGDTLIRFKVKLYNHMVEKHGFKGNIITLDKVPKVGKC